MCEKSSITPPEFHKNLLQISDVGYFYRCGSNREAVLALQGAE
jgi:hypothetical protein